MIQNESRAGCPIPFPSDPGASSGASSRRKARHRIERSSTKRKISFAVAITVGAATLIPLALPASAQRGEAASGIIWKPCTDTPSIQCGTLTLPVDRRKPAKTFDMAVARHQATNSAERLGVLFINPGGPGASGVNFVSTAMDVFPAKILERFDIVGFDPRGIGASQPIMCGNAAVLEAPRSQAEFQRLTNANLALRQDCRNRNGSLFDHADTLNVVQDMDALRAALGEKKINYYGISYGTLIGQQYAQKYGKHVRSMVLDSNMDHSLTAQDLAATSASAVEDSLKKFARWCEVTPVCALHGRKVLPHWNKLLAAADRGQLLTKEGDSVSEYDVLTEAYSDLADAKWSELAAWLEPLRIGDADRKPSPASPDNRQDGQPDLNGRLAVFCQDWNLPIRNYHDWKTLVDAERAAAPTRATPQKCERPCSDASAGRNTSTTPSGPCASATTRPPSSSSTATTIRPPATHGPAASTGKLRRRPGCSPTKDQDTARTTEASAPGPPWTPTCSRASSPSKEQPAQRSERQRRTHHVPLTPARKQRSTTLLVRQVKPRPRKPRSIAPSGFSRERAGLLRRGADSIGRRNTQLPTCGGE